MRYSAHLNPILHTWIRDSCFTCDGSKTIQDFPLLFNPFIFINKKRRDISLTVFSSLGRYVFGSEISYNKPPPRLPGLAY